MDVIINQELCNGCGACLKVCSHDAIYFKNSIPFIDENKCVSCLACVKVCPTGALEMDLKKKPIVITTPYMTKESFTTTENPVRSNQSISEKVLTFASQQILPQVMKSLTNYLDRKLVSRDEAVSTLSDYEAINFNARRRRQRRGSRSG